MANEWITQTFILFYMYADVAFMSTDQNMVSNKFVFNPIPYGVFWINTHTGRADFATQSFKKICI